MAELVIDVANHSRNNRIALLLFIISMIIADLIALQFNNQTFKALLILPMTFIVVFVLGNIADLFITENKTPEASLTITGKGIHVHWDKGQSQDIKWNEIVCMDTYQNGYQNVLRIAPKGVFSKEILYEEKHLSTSCENIMKFVHDICPYGKDISFWNENRT